MLLIFNAGTDRSHNRTLGHSCNLDRIGRHSCTGRKPVDYTHTFEDYKPSAENLRTFEDYTHTFGDYKLPSEPLNRNHNRKRHPSFRHKTCFVFDPGIKRKTFF